VDVDAILAHRVEIVAETLHELEHAEAAAQAEDEGAAPDLTDIGSLKRLLARHGLRPNKSFGQHFLISRKALDAVVEAARLEGGDNVLEVGSGTGVLTVELASRTARVVAVEIDRNILPVLRETTARFPNVEIVPRDLLDIDPEQVFSGEPYKLVANLPYYITALTLRHFLEARNRPREMVVMVQREVAERMTAAPGDMSLLALSVQFYAEPKIVARVPPTAFFPPPQVESAVVRLELHPEPPLSGAARERFFELAHAGFAEKRKQVHNSLARNLRVPQEEVARWLATAGIDPMRRAETLSLADWLRLTRASMDQHEGTAEDAEDAEGESE
jgi:16S rRNA (adenine1518-N6/adenine1519-N6)-dimethyltransferase